MSDEKLVIIRSSDSSKRWNQEAQVEVNSTDIPLERFIIVGKDDHFYIKTEDGKKVLSTEKEIKFREYNIIFEDMTKIEDRHYFRFTPNFIDKGSKTVLIESLKHSCYFIRSRGTDLYLDFFDAGDVEFKSDASWNIEMILSSLEGVQEDLALASFDETVPYAEDSMITLADSWFKKAGVNYISSIGLAINVVENVSNHFTLSSRQKKDLCLLLLDKVVDVAIKYFSPIDLLKSLGEDINKIVGETKKMTKKLRDDAFEKGKDHFRKYLKDRFVNASNTIETLVTIFNDEKLSKSLGWVEESARKYCL